MAARCCTCNGVSAKCIRCLCVRNERPCVSCLPRRSGNCLNSLATRQKVASKSVGVEDQSVLQVGVLQSRSIETFAASQNSDVGNIGIVGLF